MKTIAFVFALVLVSGVAWAQGDDPRWDTMPMKERSRQQYNPMENRWETTKGKKTLQYNSIENEWSYQEPGAVPVYNSLENRWEYPK